MNIKYSKAQLQKAAKIALAVAVPTAIAAGYIFELHARLHSLELQAKYYGEKLDSALTKLTPEKLAEMEEEVDIDIAFYEIAQSTLKNTI